MPRPFDTLSEQLLRAGIAPRYVHRYMTELKEHLEDLTTAFVNEGLPEPEAAAEAYARLGNQEELIQSMISRGELRSWSARAPWITVVLAPLSLAVGVAACVLVFIAARIYGITPGPHPIPAWFANLADAVKIVANLILPIACGWGTALIAMRQRLQSIWPIVALALVALLGSIMQLDVVLPSASSSAGRLMVGLGMLPDSRLVLNLLLILSPYFAIRWIEELSA